MAGFQPLLQFGTIVDSFNDQYALSEERRKKELEGQIADAAIADKAARDSKAVADQSIASADVARKKQLEILGGIDGELKKANRAIELGASDNPMDRLTLWALQQADPSYTRDGNIRRIEYYEKASSAIGGIEAITQTGFSDQLKQIENDKMLALSQNDSDIALAKMMELQGQERIDATTNYIAQLSGTLTQQNNIQDQALSNAPDEAIDSAIVEAKKSETKTANIGGVEISLARLEQRKLAITERKYLQTNRDMELAGRALDMMTPEDVEKAETEAAANGGLYTTEDGINIPFAKIRERRAANLNFEFTQMSQEQVLKGYDESNRRQTDERLLQTYSTVELTNMLAGDGIDPKTKQRFDKDQVMQALQMKQEAEKNNFNLDFIAETGQLTAKPAADNISYIDSMNVQPGSPLATALTTQRQVNLTAAGILGGEGSTLQQKADMLAVTTGSRESIDAAIRTEATRLAGPTADKDLIALNEAVIRGTPLPPEIAESIITERAVDPKKGMGGILNQEMNAVFVKAYNDKLDQLNNPANAAATMGMDKAAKSKEAAAYAIQALTGAASGGLTEKMFSSQAAMPGNPLRSAGVSPAQFLVISKNADEIGIKQYLDSGLVPEGVDRKALTPEMLRASPPIELIRMQQANMMVELEKIKPGLAKQYTDWWSSPDADKFVQTFMTAESDNKGTVSDMMTWSLVAPSVPNQIETYKQLALQGRETMVTDVLQKQHAEFITFHGSPQAKQAYLIDATPDMNDQEKKLAWTMIQPLFETAKKQGLNAAQTNQYIEGQLAVMKPPAGEYNAVLKKLLAGRGPALATIERFNKAQPANAGFILEPYTLKRALGLGGAPIEDAVAGFDWLKPSGT